MRHLFKMAKRFYVDKPNAAKEIKRFQAYTTDWEVHVICQKDTGTSTWYSVQLKLEDLQEIFPFF